MEQDVRLKLNAKLQAKKNALRKALADKGILQKGGKNQYDRYTYFSEAQYKELFTKLFSEHGLELTVSEVGYEQFDGTDKQPFGRIVKLQFALTDCETGFSEESVACGEGLDKGDKAGYKASTGALKYYLANTFMVATGDDPETESPDGKKKKTEYIMYNGQKAGEVYGDGSKVVMCPNCQRPVLREYSRKLGKWLEPEEVLEQCGGVCLTCFKKAKEENHAE